MSASTKSGDNMANKILEKLKSLDVELTSLIKMNSERIGELLKKTDGLKEDSEDKKKVEAELIKLQTQLDNVRKESEEKTTKNKELENQLSQLKKIDDQVGQLEQTVNLLSVNNEGVEKQIKNLTPSPTKGGFQYNKKHPKHKRPFRLFSRSNSKTTSKKSKKQRRRPGKSVKKGGMKTRRRRRNKKSKKSKKRRK